MEERIEQEFALLRAHYRQVDYVAEGRWARVWPVRTGLGWSHDPVPAAFQIPSGYPGTSPYGFYVPTGLTHNGRQPKSYQVSPSNQPLFHGTWDMFSWQGASDWRATADLVTGSNLFNWTRSFQDRFNEGA